MASSDDVQVSIILPLLKQNDVLREHAGLHVRGKGAKNVAIKSFKNGDPIEHGGVERNEKVGLDSKREFRHNIGDGDALRDGGVKKDLRPSLKKSRGWGRDSTRF